MLTAVLVYFQLYLPMANGNVNACLADPLVLICASLFLVSLPSGDAHWRIPRLAILVAGCTVVVMAGFVHGWLAFGSNAWAATKASGWFVLVGYALAAALIVRVGGETGRQLVFKTLIVAFLAIACLEYAIYASKVLGLAVPLRSPLRMEGFAQDPNAFAFQCLVVMALLLRTPGTSIRATTALGACLLMLFLSASRSGAIAAATMFAVAVYFRPRAFLTLAAAAGFAALAG